MVNGCAVRLRSVIGVMADGVCGAEGDAEEREG
jgi:hypothetical protein